MAKVKKDEESAPETAAPAGGGAATADAGSADPHVPQKLGRVSLGVIAGVVLLINLPMVHYFLFRSQMPATQALPFREDFENPASVQEKFWSSGGLWRTEKGQLLSPGVKNNPLWLKADLPNDVAVEFDVRSQSPEGDIKVEIFGDGSDHASGYILIHGGWNNSISIIARLDEHGQANNAFMSGAGQQLLDQGTYRADTRVRVEGAPFKVEIGRTYHWRIERRGKVISWFIDNQPFMTFNDPLPLTGKGHNRFGFSSWEAQLFFDNLTVSAL
ncbi:MAG: hypothetical protein QM817_03175 [Archangium sp.]